MLAKDGLLDAVMIGHLYHPRFSDGAKLPASLSGRAVRALRDKAGSASTAWWSATTWRWARCATSYSLEERVIKAVNAGTDLLVFSNVQSHDPELGPKIHAIIADAVRDGRISRVAHRAGLRQDQAVEAPACPHDLAGKG